MASNFTFKNTVNDLRKRTKFLMTHKDYISKQDYFTKSISNLLKNKRSKFLSCFKEHLIYNDKTEFNKK